jgi:hypothetical protein
LPRHRSSAAAAPAAPAETPVNPESVPEPKLEAALPTGPAKPSLVAEVLELKRSWESKKDAAIQELLAKRTAIEKQFNADLAEIEHQLQELGYVREPEWVPVPASKVQPFRKAKAKAKSKSARQRFCTICSTDPENPVTGHDRRSHRSQGKRKKPFTAAELKALG